jgi:hypothetical protein
VVTIDPDQLPMFPAAVSSEPTGWWADAGRYMVGEVEAMPETPPPVLVAARELGSAALASGGVAPSMALGAGPSPGQTGASHARGRQEAP